MTKEKKMNAQPLVEDSFSFLPEEVPTLGNTRDRMEVLQLNDDIYIFNRSNTDDTVWQTKWNPLKDRKGERIEHIQLSRTAFLPIPMTVFMQTDRGISGTIVGKTAVLAHKGVADNNFWVAQIDLEKNDGSFEEICVTDFDPYFTTDLTPAVSVEGTSIYFAFRGPTDKTICLASYNMDTDEFKKVYESTIATDIAPNLAIFEMQVDTNKTNDGLIERLPEDFLMAVGASEEREVRYVAYGLTGGYKKETLGTPQGERGVVIDTPLAVNIVDSELVQFLYSLKAEPGYGVLDFEIPPDTTYGQFAGHQEVTDPSVNSKNAPTILQIGRETYLFYSDEADDNKIKYEKIL